MPGNPRAIGKETGTHLSEAIGHLRLEAARRPADAPTANRDGQRRGMSALNEKGAAELARLARLSFASADCREVIGNEAWGHRIADGVASGWPMALRARIGPKVC
jgi:hypothetical protein